MTLVGIGDLDWGLGWGIGIEDWDWGLGWGVGLEIGIGNWDLGLVVNFCCDFWF